MEKIKKDKSAFLYILLFLIVPVIWGFAFPITKIVLDNNTPVFLLLAGRFGIGAIIVYALSAGKKKSFKIQTNTVPKGIILGLIVFAAYATQTFGAAITTPDKNGLLTGIYVVLIPLFKSIFKGKLQLKPIVDGVICIIGMLVFFNIFGQKTTGFNIGDLLTIICAVLFAFQFLFLERYSPELDPMDFTTVQLVTISVVSLVCSLIFEIDSYHLISVPHLLLGFAVLGVLSSGFCFLIQTVVQAKLSGTTVALIGCLEAVFAVIFSYAFGYTEFTASFVVGALIILLSVISGCFQKQELLADIIKERKERKIVRNISQEVWAENNNLTANGDIPFNNLHNSPADNDENCT